MRERGDTRSNGTGPYQLPFRPSCVPLRPGSSVGALAREAARDALLCPRRNPKRAVRTARALSAGGRRISSLS